MVIATVNDDDVLRCLQQLQLIQLFHCSLYRHLEIIHDRLIPSHKLTIMVLLLILTAAQVGCTQFSHCSPSWISDYELNSLTKNGAF